MSVQRDVVAALMAVSEGTYSSDDARSFAEIFRQLGDVSDFERGFVQFTLMLANFVLNNNLAVTSIKEPALAATQ